jgi:hypothetical protein
MDMSNLYLATTSTTTVYICTPSCSGAFNSAGSTSCSQICYDDDGGSSCSGASTVCPNSASGSSPTSIASSFNSYCNNGSSYDTSDGGSYTSTNGFGVNTGHTLYYYYNPCGGSGTNSGGDGGIPSAGTCCVYDSAAGDYFCIYSSCTTVG